MDLIRMLVLLPLMALAQQHPAVLAAEPPAADAPVAKADAPASRPAVTVAPDARTLLDEVSKAYHALPHLQMAGALRIDINLDGEKPEQHEVKFTSSFDAPNKFRHDAAGEVLIGSTGTDVYTLKAKDKNYTLATAPKDRVALSEYPPEVIQALTSQNLSLALVLSADAAQELLTDATAVSKAPDTQIDGVAYPTLKVSQDDDTTALVALDPATHLIKQIQSDLTLALKKRRPDLLSAVVSTLYTDISTAAPEGPVSYAWAPPAGAVDAAAAAMARAGGEGASDGSQLLGKPAPAFKLASLDGSSVTLDSLKGHVVILDFWATWCAPCRLGLPKIDALAAAHKDEGLKVFAVNDQEDAEKAKAFVAETKLAIPVLLDTDGKTGDAYGREAIPLTVVIGPDGKVVKAFVGYSENESEEIEKAIKALLKKAS